MVLTCFFPPDEWQSNSACWRDWFLDSLNERANKRLVEHLRSGMEREKALRFTTSFGLNKNASQKSTCCCIVIFVILYVHYREVSLVARITSQIVHFLLHPPMKKQPVNVFPQSILLASRFPWCIPHRSPQSPMGSRSYDSNHGLFPRRVPSLYFSVVFYSPALLISYAVPFFFEWFRRHPPCFHGMIDVRNHKRNFDKFNTCFWRRLMQ